MLRKLCVLSAVLALAGAALPSYGAQRSIVISGDSGGSVLDYALQAARYKQSNTRLMITGRCDSACTLYLALPAANICVGQAAYFRFHSPSAEAGSARAEKFMLRQYPGWVRQWIAGQGGLSKQLKTMHAVTAQNYLPSCSSPVAAR